MHIWISILTLFVAHSVLACGGLFCSGSNPIVVDQSGERILFEILPNGDTRTTVDIVYAGRPESFSWIVPVSEVPSEMAVSDRALFNQLGQLLGPSFTPSQLDTSACPQPPISLAACGSFSVVDVGRPAPRGVVELPDVGPFGDIVVVDGESADAIFDYLVDNDYTLTAAMRPVLQEYFDEGQKFMALKLRPGQDAESIVPLQFTCPAEEGAVTIPLRLTKVAAEPEMSITVYIAANQRYAPMNYRSVEVDPLAVFNDAVLGRTNYYALVSKLVDDEGGQAFVTEASVPTAGIGLLTEYAHITRLYTRMSAWEMTEDPAFAPSGGDDVTAVVGDADRIFKACTGAASTPPCGSTYCGQGGLCVQTELGDSCECQTGLAARSVSNALGPAAFCVDLSFDVMGAAAGDPCLEYDCGLGSCVANSGVATCVCEEGAAAAVDAAGFITCADTTEGPRPTPLDWQVYYDAQESLESGGCDANSSGSFFLTFAMLLAVAFGLRGLKK